MASVAFVLPTCRVHSGEVKYRGQEDSRPLLAQETVSDMGAALFIRKVCNA